MCTDYIEFCEKKEGKCCFIIAKILYEKVEVDLEILPQKILEKSIILNQNIEMV